jgi:hypothetical protein
MCAMPRVYISSRRKEYIYILCYSVARGACPPVHSVTSQSVCISTPSLSIYVCNSTLLERYLASPNEAQRYSRSVLTSLDTSGNLSSLFIASTPPFPYPIINGITETDSADNFLHDRCALCYQEHGTKSTDINFRFSNSYSFRFFYNSTLRE